ncbi:MAG: alpha/beta hydrolase [Chloroflexi bacterium]|nr:alpha/beta hydrolase [Chloroflexota bacterium]
MSREMMVPVPGGRLHTVDDGDGPPVLLLHAGIVDLRAWDPLIAHLLARGLRAIRYDARGYGLSETDDVEYSNRADVIAVLDACGVDRACLVGNSRGGQIAVDAATEHPDRVAALVLLGASVGGYEAPATPDEEALFAEMERLEEAGDPEATADFDVRLWVDGPGQSPDRVPPAIREAVRAMDLAVGDPTRTRGRPVRLDPPANERLGGLTMPILAMAGALDVSDVWATALHLQDACPDAAAELVPGVAHMIAMEVPELVADRIASLVARADLEG